MNVIYHDKVLGAPFTMPSARLVAYDTTLYCDDRSRADEQRSVIDFVTTTYPAASIKLCLQKSVFEMDENRTTGANNEAE
ncbi:hypothetical protein CCR75_004962 [Bremia lactucae]|uniref:Uncharacterized protein n=1 Tax=Bremia lactucae TaxID=4779 RepID=A0A976FF15_BRELC|nr:hypothetical protein CCR75_004962 [Bremia lactucae]